MNASAEKHMETPVLLNWDWIDFGFRYEFRLPTKPTARIAALTRQLTEPHPLATGTAALVPISARLCDTCRVCVLGPARAALYLQITTERASEQAVSAELACSMASSWRPLDDLAVL
jgi:hypothetical protein